LTLALMGRYGQRAKHELIGHLLILELIKGADLMAML
jgi:hypothetical protein